MKTYPSIIKKTLISCLLITISQTAFSATKKAQQPLITLKVPVELKNMLPLKRSVLCAVDNKNGTTVGIGKTQLKQDSGNIAEMVKVIITPHKDWGMKRADLELATDYTCHLSTSSPPLITNPTHDDSLNRAKPAFKKYGDAIYAAPNTKFNNTVTGKINWNQ